MADMKLIEELEALKQFNKDTLLKCYPCASNLIEQLIYVTELKQKAIDIDKAWQFIEVTIIREGHASEYFVKEMNRRFKKAMEE